MTSLAGWSNLESFLTSTTPVVTSPYSLQNLVQAFKHPCAFGVEVKLAGDEIVYYLPTLSGISIPGLEFFETSPPHLRVTAFQKLEELSPFTEPNENSWMALLWIPINKIPPGKVYGSVLVYYNLFAEVTGYLRLHGLLLFKIPEEWVNVYQSNNEINTELTLYWTGIKEKLLLQAKTFHKSLKIVHHDFIFIISREKITV